MKIRDFTLNSRCRARKHVKSVEDSSVFRAPSDGEKGNIEENLGNRRLVLGGLFAGMVTETGGWQMSKNTSGELDVIDFIKTRDAGTYYFRQRILTILEQVVGTKVHHTLAADRTAKL